MHFVRCWPMSLLLLNAAASAAPVAYEIDPAHTYPSFEADHFGGVSTWRGKFNSSSGRIVLDRDARSGTVEVTVDTTSVDFGHEEMNTHALKADLLDAVAHPAATYRGTFAAFDGERPTRIDGTLTLRGVTRPLSLQVASFKCVPHPLHQRELCGADASATFERDDFGIVAGKDHGFDMTVTLRIQVEAVVPEAP